MKQNRHIAIIGTLITAAAFAASAQEPARLHGFGPAAVSGQYPPSSQQVILSGDVDGDHLDDLIIFQRGTPGKEGDVDVMRNTGGTFAAAGRWEEYFCIGAEIPLIGDFNGDGRADIATFVRSTVTGGGQGDVYVALSSGTAFVGGSRWHDYFCIGDEVPVAGDFNGDGLDDVATCTRGSSADVYVAVSNGASFAGPALWQSNFCPGAAIPMAGDFNGDHFDDLAAFMRSSVPGQEGDVRVTLAATDGSSAFTGDTLWHGFFCVGDEMAAVADVNADGKADILTYVRGPSDVYAALSSGTAFSGTGDRWHDSFRMPAFYGAFLAGHYNGDASADIMTVGAESLQPGVINVALCGAHAIPLPSTTAADIARLATDFGTGTLGLFQPPGFPNQNIPAATRPAREERYLLCVLLASPTSPGGTAFSLTNASAAALCFGPGHPNLRSYFDEMSGGKFTVRPANLGGGTGVIGPLNVTAPTAPWLNGIEAADASFNFAQYDLNGNGYVDTDELLVLVFDNISEAGASNRFYTRWADGKFLRLHISAGGHRTNLQTAAHEVSHSLGTLDLYNSGGCDAYGATLMSCTHENIFRHLDAWHKMRLGWVTPRIYDVSEFPGGAWISAPQEARTALFKPPVMLYDPARTTREHYTLEFRNNTYASDGWAGYDQHAGGHGLLAWYTRTTPGNDPDRDELRIVPGNNGVINSFQNGDDVIFEGNLVPGPNRILESVPSGDDGYLGDNTCFVTLTPDILSSRRDVEVYNDPAQSHALNWWTKPAPGGPPPGNVPSGVSFRTAAFGGGGYVEWGKRFSPWLDQPLSTNLSAGGTYLFSGDLGVLNRGSDGTSYAVLRSPRTGREFSLSTELDPDLQQQWDGLRAYLRVPLSTPPGQYNIQVYRSSARTMVSNAWPVTVRNPYYVYAAYHFTSAEIAAGTLVDPSADPDSDGLVNGLEFMLGSSPRDISDGRQYYSPAVKNGLFNLTWSGPVEAEGFFKLVPEISTDLSKWNALPPPNRSDNGVFAYYTASVPVAGNSHSYLRLRVTFPAWK